MEVSQKIKKKKLLCDPPVYFLGIYPKTMEILNQKYTHIPMFIAALFAISKIWKQFKSQYMYEWIKKMWVYIYTMAYYSTIRKPTDLIMAEYLDL